MRQIKLFQPNYSAEMESILLKVAKSGSIASGSFVEQFERNLSELLGLSNVVTTSDVTSAIYCSLLLAGVSEGDEVISSAYNCLASNSAIVNIKAQVVWVDVLPNSVYMDPDDFERSITSKTKAAIVYHVAGYPGYIREISSICKKHKIILIEDCNNSLLANVEDCTVGSFGDFAVFSFYPNRQINAFEGGAIKCPNFSVAERARRLRKFGIDYQTFRDSNGEISPLSDVPEMGASFSLNNVHSALGCEQISSVMGRINKTRANARRLQCLLEPEPSVKVIKPLDHTLPSFWAFLILVKNRDVVLEKLKAKGVLASTLHFRNDMYSCFNASSLSDHSNLAKLQNDILALPCGWWLSQGDIEYVVETLRECLA